MTYNIYEYKPSILKSSIITDLKGRKMKYWKFEQFLLRDSHFYSLNLVEHYNKYVYSVFQYINGTEISFLSEYYNLSSHTLNSFLKDILLRKSQDFLLKKWIGFHSNRLGLDHAKGRMKKFYYNTKKMPRSSENQLFKRIAQRICEGGWAQYGYHKWNDLLLSVFGKLNKKMTSYDEKSNTFEVIKTKLLNFEKCNKRLPKIQEFPSIYHAIRRNVYSNKNIESWNDLLVKIFNETNQEYNIYTGKKGLDFATQLLRNFKKNNDRLPTVNDDFSSIMTAIGRKYWSNFGINSWNDLLYFVFGVINRQGKKKYFVGKKGLLYAIKILKEYEEKNQKLPIIKSNKTMELISKRCYRKEWLDYGITSWNDLLIKVFGKLNCQKHYLKKNFNLVEFLEDSEILRTTQLMQMAFFNI